MNTAADKDPATLIAILRGLTESDAAAVGRCLYEAGLRTVEVPLNSPEPLRTITTLRALLPDDCLVGAGTVLTAEQVRLCHDAGAQIIVSPNTDTGVITETLELGMQSLPGTATPSEAFRAIGAGATRIKIFPAAQVGFDGLKAWTAVVPREIGLIPVGGVDRSNIGAWLAAGGSATGARSLVRAGAPSFPETRSSAMSGRTSNGSCATRAISSRSSRPRRGTSRRPRSRRPRASPFVARSRAWLPNATAFSASPSAGIWATLTSTANSSASTSRPRRLKGVWARWKPLRAPNSPVAPTHCSTTFDGACRRA